MSASNDREAEREPEQSLQEEAASFDLSGGGAEALPHPRALAFLGDAVYELFLREWSLRRGLSLSQDLHTFTSMLAKAETQVAFLHYLEPQLSAAELELVRRGRNLAVSAGRRSGQAIYRQATSFEVLIGALHLRNPARLKALWALAEPFLLPIGIASQNEESPGDTP